MRSSRISLSLQLLILCQIIKALQVESFNVTKNCLQDDILSLIRAQLNVMGFEGRFGHSLPLGLTHSKGILIHHRFRLLRRER